MSQTTKRALEASLKKLLLQKPLNKITINDITEDCGINRMTFYYHFKDIYDLVDWILVEDAQQALEGRQSVDDWNQAFLDILLKIQANKLLVLNVYRSVSREQVEQYLYKMVDPLLHEFVDKETQDISIQDEDKQFVIDFFKYALVGILIIAAIATPGPDVMSQVILFAVVYPLYEISIFLVRRHERHVEAKLRAEGVLDAGEGLYDEDPKA